MNQELESKSTILIAGVGIFAWELLESVLGLDLLRKLEMKSESMSLNL